MKLFTLSSLLATVFLSTFFIFPSLGGELEELKSEIEYVKQRIARQTKDVEKVKKSLVEMEAKFKEKKGDLEKMEQVSSGIQKSNFRAKELEYTIRQKLAVLEFFDSQSNKVYTEEGAKFPELKTTKGRVLKDVTIEKILGDAIKMRHAGGFATVPFQELPPSVVGNILFRPANHNVQGLPDGLFARRPESMATSKEFEKTGSVEKLQRERRVAAAHAAADKKRTGDLNNYRNTQIAMHEKFLGERKGNADARESARQDVIKENEVIDKKLVLLFSKVDSMEFQKDALDKAFNDKIIDYDGVGDGAKISKKENDRRKKILSIYLRAKEHLVQTIGITKKEIIDLRASKKSAR